MAKKIEIQYNSALKQVDKAKKSLERYKKNLKKNVEFLTAKQVISIEDMDIFEPENKNILYEKVSKVIHEDTAVQSDDKIWNSLWNVITGLNNLNESRDKLQYKTTKLEKIQKELDETESNVDISEVQYEKELYKYLKTANQLEVQGLDEWLEKYEINYRNLIKKLDIPDWKKSLYLEDTSNMVRAQKINLMKRTYKHIGKLQKVSFSKIGEDGSFNGIVNGELGSAKVETILAWGLIQRPHYRVLVK